MFQNENETSCDEGLIKLKHHLDHREKKLKEISVLLAEINIDLTTALEKNQELDHEKQLYLHKLERKTEQIFQEKTDKNWIEDKMIRLEKENARLNKSLQKTQLNAFDICNSKIRNENKVTNHSKNENSEYSTLDEKIDNDDRGGYQPPSFD